MGAAKVVAENEKSLPDHLLSRLTWESCSWGVVYPGADVPKHGWGWVERSGAGDGSGPAVVPVPIFEKKHKLGTQVV